MSYIRHGVLGAEMLRAEGMPRHARVCERPYRRWTVDFRRFVSRNLPLPHTDLLPETLEEQVICYADKFFSKNTTRPRKDHRAGRKERCETRRRKA